MKGSEAATVALAITLFAGTPGQAQQLGGLRGAAEGLSAVHLVQERGDRGERGGDRDVRDRDRRRGGGLSLYIGPGAPGIYARRPAGTCGWLRRRAVDTGSNYWWVRYRNCLSWR